MKYISKLRRFAAFAVALATLAAAIPAVSNQKVSALTDRQTWFAELMGSFARADMHKTGILASLTAGQAIFESGWGTSRIGVEGKNLFGYKAYSSWSGRVYEYRSATLYSNYDDMLIALGNDDRNASPWRAYADWRESVEDHSTLLCGSDRYAALVGETDYKKAAFAIVEAGYTSDDGYAEQLIAIIENYGLTMYDDLTPNEYGVIAIEMNKAQLFLSINDGADLSYEIFEAEFVPEESEDASQEPSDMPSDDISDVSDDEQSSESSDDTSDTMSESTSEGEPIRDESADQSDETSTDETSADTGATGWLDYTVEWESSDPSVASVDQNGNVTALKEGVALIRAKVGNREACCLVEVSGETAYDAYVTSTLNVREEPNTNGKKLGIFPKGQGIYLHSENVDGWYLCEGIGTDGEHLKGWASASYIVLNNHKGLATQIHAAKSLFSIAVGDTAQIVYALAPATATQTDIKWTSANTNIATVSSDGIISAVAKGATTVTGVTSGDATVTVDIRVGDTATNYVAVTNTRLYVRAASSADSKALGIIDADTEIEVVGEEVDGWYHVIVDSKNGKTIEGWSKARYISITSLVGGTPPAAELTFTDESIVSSGGSLYGIIPETTLGGLNGICTTSGEIKLFAVDGTQKTDGQKLATGDVLVLYYEGVEIDRKTLIIRGDVNCDGEINSADYLFIKRYMVGTLELSEHQKLAADASCDGELLVNDYLMVVRHYLGEYTIIQKAP